MGIFLPALAYNILFRNVNGIISNSLSWTDCSVVHITVSLAWIMTVCYLQQGNIFVFPQLWSEQSGKKRKKRKKQTNETLISRDLGIYQIKATAQILTFNLKRPFRSLGWQRSDCLQCLKSQAEKQKNVEAAAQQGRSHPEKNNKTAIWVKH